MKKKRKSFFWNFWEIESKKEAFEVIKEVSITFILIGVLTIVLGLFIEELRLGIVDGIMYLILAAFFIRTKSRSLSTLLLLLSLGSLYSTTLGKLGYISGGTNLYLAIFLTYCGISGTYASFKYHSRYIK